MITKPSVTTRAGALAIALMLASGAIGLAQNQAPPAAPPETREMGATPLRLEIVLSRLDAKGTRVSRMPYVFSATPAPPGNVCRLRMGAQVPVQGGREYRDIGTNIDCNVRPMPDSRFQIVISIEETSVLSEDMIEPNAAAKFGDMPVFRSYQSTNTVLLRNGESTRFTTAVDRVTGETVVAEVTVTVIK